MVDHHQCDHHLGCLNEFMVIYCPITCYYIDQGADRLLYQRMEQLHKVLLLSKPASKRVVQREKALQKESKVQKQAECQQEALRERERNREERMAQFYGKQTKRVKQNQQPPLSMGEVKKGLRLLQQPVTLFGESEEGRYKRLLRMQAFKAANPHFEMHTYDQEFEQKRRKQEQFTELDNKYRERLIQPQLGDDPAFLRRKKAMVETEKQSPSITCLCDQLYLWLHKVLRDWARTLDLKYGTQSTEGTAAHARFDDTIADLESLFTVLRGRAGDRDMLVAMHKIMNYALLREYHRVNDAYLLLTIGTAPWPMGVAMLGITVKKNAQKVSHVLTDEVSRRWMQSLKRIITVSQELYPSSNPNEAVLFSINSAL